MSASEIRKTAREALAGKWGKAALIMLVYGIITGLISIVLSLIPVLGSIAQIVISIPISFGLITTYMKLRRGEEVTYTEFLNNGFNNFAGSWKLVLWTIVKLLVPFIVLIVATVILTVGTGMTVAGSARATIESSTASVSSVTSAGGIVAFIGVIAVIIASIWFTIKSYLYKIAMYILADNPNKDAKEIVEESESLMNGNRLKLFFLELSFIGWIILAGFTFGIGMLFLVPYMVIAEIVFYEVLSGKKSNTVEATVEPTAEPVVEESPAESVQEEDNGPISGD